MSPVAGDFFLSKLQRNNKKLHHQDIYCRGPGISPSVFCCLIFFYKELPYLDSFLSLCLPVVNLMDVLYISIIQVTTVIQLVVIAEIRKDPI